MKKCLVALFFVFITIGSPLSSGRVIFGPVEEISSLIVSHINQAHVSVEGLLPLGNNRQLCRAVQTASQKNVSISIFLDSSAKKSECSFLGHKRDEKLSFDWIEKGSGTQLTGLFLIIDGRTVVFQSEFWKTTRGNTEEAALIVSNDSDVVSGFQAEYQNIKNRKKGEGGKDRNWSYGPIDLTINNHPLDDNPVTICIEENSEVNVFLRVNLTSDHPWKKAHLTLESSPPLIFVDKSGRAKKNPDRTKLTTTPVPIFGPLRKGKPWLIVIGLKNAVPKNYRWKYIVESSEGMARGEFEVVLNQ